MSADSMAAAQDLEAIKRGEKNQPLRMFIALQMLRAWNHGTAGYSADVVHTVHTWIDGGMTGPIPWPDNPFFAEWAVANGYSNISGFVGFRFTVERWTVPNA